MICPVCNKEVPEGHTICDFCGTPIQPAPQPVQPAAPVQQAVPTQQPVMQAAPVQQPVMQAAPVQPAMAYAPAQAVAVAPAPTNNKKKVLAIVLPIVISVVVLIFVIVGVIVGSRISGMNELNSQLNRDWSRVEQTDSGSYYHLYLDFDKESETIEYIFDSTYINETIATYDYKVVAPDEIEVTRDNGTTQNIKIKFNDDKDMITMTPALTSTDGSENWFHLEEYWDYN